MFHFDCSHSGLLGLILQLLVMLLGLLRFVTEKQHLTLGISFQFDQVAILCFELIDLDSQQLQFHEQLFILLPESEVGP